MSLRDHALADQPGAGRSARSAAFTLVELLVVIAIIAILAGLILAAIAGARAEAKKVRCLANLKQMALAYESYQSTWKGRFPPVYPVPGNPDYAFTHLLAIEMGMGGTLAEVHGNVFASADPAQAAPGFAKTVFACPAHDPDEPLFRPYYHYGQNYWAGLISRRKFSRPEQTMLAMDAYGEPALQAGALEAISNRHRRGSNVLFADGHALWMEADDPAVDFSVSAVGARFWSPLGPPLSPARMRACIWHGQRRGRAGSGDQQVVHCLGQLGQIDRRRQVGDPAAAQRQRLRLGLPRRLGGREYQQRQIGSAGRSLGAGQVRLQPGAGPCIGQVKHSQIGRGFAAGLAHLVQDQTHGVQVRLWADPQRPQRHREALPDQLARARPRARIRTAQQRQGDIVELRGHLFFDAAQGLWPDPQGAAELLGGVDRLVAAVTQQQRVRKSVGQRQRGRGLHAVGGLLTDAAQREVVQRDGLGQVLGEAPQPHQPPRIARSRRPMTVWV